jgi:YfiH family protein
MVLNNNFITPNWPAPDNIIALSTTRFGGSSLPPYNSFNLGTHVGDELTTVLQNRTALQQALNLPKQPAWLNQIHSNHVVEITDAYQLADADASFTGQSQMACVVLTADCLPILLCNQTGTLVAAIHAGWKGLAQGVIQNTIAALKVNPEDLLAWLGPAISQPQYEVGDEVRNVFIEQDVLAETAFKPSPHERWLADLYELARQILGKCQVTHIYGGNYCSFTQQDLFYSYRREPTTGRFASLILLT